MGAQEDPARPYVPGDHDPVILVPTATHLGHARIPTVTSESGEQGTMTVPRITFDTVVGSFTVAMNDDNMIGLCKGLAQLLHLTEPSQLRIARNLPAPPDDWQLPWQLP